MRRWERPCVLGDLRARLPQSVDHVALTGEFGDVALTGEFGDLRAYPREAVLALGYSHVHEATCGPTGRQ